MGALKPKKMDPAIRATKVRYIKLGWGGIWENECEKNGIIRFGFGSSNRERFPLCRDGQWNELTKSFIAEGKSRGTATRFTNETRLFFEDDGSILWITFIGDRLCWGFLDPTAPKRHEDGDGVWRTIAGGWRWTDLNGEPLTKDRLSGALTQIAAYRGTSCNVKEAKYVIRRINGQKIPEVENALDALKGMKSSVLGLIKLLGFHDFEILVDLVFSTSGWRRQGVVGGTEKTRDIDITLPSTGERAFVQVKSKTNNSELIDYIGKLDELGPYHRMFFVYHSGEADSEDNRVFVIGPEKLAALVVDAGLVNWLIHKVS